MARTVDVYQDEQRFWLQASEGASLVISRPEASARLTSDRRPPSLTFSCSIRGLLGIVNLHAGPYLVAVTEVDCVGEVLGAAVYRVLRTEILPCVVEANLSDPLLQDELMFLGLLKSFLNDHHRSGLFFSPTYDLSTRLQKAPANAADLNQFVANGRILGSLATEGGPFVLRCIQGFVGIIEDVLMANGRRLSVTLISRRSNSRVGTRYHSRGVDDDGNVSNFVETEEIVVADDGTVCSFVQVRGSIPVYWRQPINMRYKPPLQVESSSARNLRVFSQHFRDLQREFGPPMVALNLVDSKGFEGRLAAMFAKYARELESAASPSSSVSSKSSTSTSPSSASTPSSEMVDLSYVHFDYHAQVKGSSAGPGSRLDALNRLLATQIEGMGWYERSPSGQARHTQRGIVRTNCIDCLDRTNVAQSSLARLVMTRQLRTLGYLTGEEHLGDFNHAFLGILRHLWADNGDALSRQYSGTGALKADVTRYGARTVGGMWNDFTNSIVRYYRNNFSDGTTQDAMDVFFGRFEATGSMPLLAVSRTHALSRQAALAGVALWLLVLATSLAKAVAPGQSSRLYYLTILAVTVVVGRVAVDRLGIHMVQYPRLLPSPQIDLEEHPAMHHANRKSPPVKGSLVHRKPHNI